jgi:hypothetical protein
MENLLKLFDEATPMELLTGLSWYNVARIWIGGRAAKYATTPETVAGIVAALSPMNKWEQNLIDAVRILEQGAEATVCTFNREKAKALKIRDGAHPLDTLGGLKVLAFYDNFIDDESELVTIDRHAWNALQGERQLISERGPRLTPKRYQAASDAYKELAEYVGIYPYQAQAVVWEVWRNRL